MKAHLAALVGKGRELGARLRNAALLVQEGSYSEIYEKLQRRIRKPQVKLGSLSGSGPLPEAPAGAAEAYRRALDFALDAALCAQAELTFRAPETPLVSVLVVLDNDAAPLLGCLRSLLEQSATLDFELVLVEDSCRGDTLALLGLVQGAHVIHNPEQKGALGAYGQAAAVARGRHLLLLKPGAVLLPGSLTAAFALCEGDPSVGAVGGRIIDPEGRLQEAGGITWSDGTLDAYAEGENPRASQHMFERDVDYCSDAFLLTRRSAFDEVGGLDAGYSETLPGIADYCLQLAQHGRRVVYEPRATVVLASPIPDKSAADRLRRTRDSGRFATRQARYLATRQARSPAHLLAARSARRRPRLLFIEDRVPHPHLGMGYPRSFEMLSIAHDAGYEVTLLPTMVPDEAWPSIYADLPHSIEVVLGYPREKIEDFLATRVGYYEVILVARPHNMECFRTAMTNHPEWFTGVRIVYDAEALFCLRTQAYQQLLGTPLPEEKVQEEIAREVALTQGASVVLSVSPLEQKQFERNGVRDVRLLIHTTEIQPTTNSFHARRDILFVGSMHRHPSPNSDSILWFVREVFPRLRQRLGADLRLLIAGQNNTNEVRRLQSDSISVLGVVPDLASLFESCRIFVAPTRFAAGVPIKVCEAAAKGIPCVTSTLIASQLGWRSGHALLSASTEAPAEFADQCVALYSDERLWTTVRENALALVSELCSREKFAETLRSALGTGNRGRNSALSP